MFEVNRKILVCLNNHGKSTVIEACKDCSSILLYELRGEGLFF